MIQQEIIGKHTVYVAEFGTGDIAIINARLLDAKNDNQIWLVQDEQKPESEWDNQPYENGVLSDSFNGEPMPIVLRFKNSKSISQLIKSLTDIFDSVQLEETRERIQRLKALQQVKEISESGYAGTLSTGEIVDRRDYPEAMPIQANPMFNIPAPLPLPGPSNKGAIL